MLFVSLFALLLCAVSAQDYPRRPLGFTYKGGSPYAPIQWEAFIDINCPDCRTAYPVFTRVADHYGPQTVSLRVYNYPLPWHSNSFMGVAGVFAVNDTTKGMKTFDFYKAIFDNQDQFNVLNTTEKTADDVLGMYAQLAQSLDVDHDSFWRGATSEENHDRGEMDWRLGSSRAVAGTPTFFINGYRSDGDETWKYEDWVAVFDKLLTRASVSADDKCKIGTKRCEYLPGKVECCTPGEGCIPNVGCRC